MLPFFHVPRFVQGCAALFFSTGSMALRSAVQQGPDSDVAAWALDAHLGQSITAHRCQVSTPRAAFATLAQWPKNVLETRAVRMLRSYAKRWGLMFEFWYKRKGKWGLLWDSPAQKWWLGWGVDPVALQAAVVVRLQEQGRLAEHCSSTSAQSYSPNGYFFQSSKMLPSYHSLVTI